jgi:formylglycine-generating enzyme required for sulfatase activity
VQLLESGALEPRERIAVGNVLGQLGDPRFRIKTAQQRRIALPPLEQVNSGKWKIGALKDHFSYADETPRHLIVLPSFEIGKFPVTNLEFRYFVRAKGYEQQKHWSDLGWSWRCGEMNEKLRESLVRAYLDVRIQCREQWARMEEGELPALEEVWSETFEGPDVWWRILLTESDEEAEQHLRDFVESSWSTPHEYPAYWDDSPFQGENKPVIVSWFEAEAYCKWLSSMTGQEYRLPNEFEWEVASRGNSEREYTWKGEWDSKKLNTLELTHRKGVLTTSPVGAFPEGRSVFGLLDMLGNVWEWTSSPKLDYPYSVQESRDQSLYEDSRRIVRGGSWAVTKPNARCSCRGNFPVDNAFSNYIGFRVCTGELKES